MGRSGIVPPGHVLEESLDIPGEAGGKTLLKDSPLNTKHRVMDFLGQGTCSGPSY